MTDTLLLHFSPEHEDTATWSLVNNQGELTSLVTTAPLSDATTISEGHRCIVLLDSSCIHLNHVQLPISNRQKMLRAVPFALEEQIADEVEDFHFVIGKNEPGSGMPVAGIRRDQLEQILEVFDAAGIFPDAIIPDVLCLPGSAEQWCVLQHHERMLVEYDLSYGASIDVENLPLLLQTSLSSGDLRAPEKILLFRLDGDTSAISAQQLRDSLREQSALETDVPEINEVSYNTHPLVVFCGHYLDAMPLNLLQGSYKPKRRNAGKWQRWRLAASLVLIWLGLYLGASVFELNRLQQKNDRLHVQIEQIYKKTFPGSKRIVNARVQMEQKLDELKDTGGAKDEGLLTLLGEAIGEVSKVTDVTVQSLSFRNNRMDIELTGKGLQSIENLNRFLNQNPKLKAEIVSSTSEKTGVKGNIRIKRAGA
jgi:general secretion pathway protein L